MCWLENKMVVVVVVVERMCWAWVRTLLGVGLASGSPRAAAYLPPPSVGGLDLISSSSGCALFGAWVPPIR